MYDSADEFEWDEDNEEHIAEHDVDPYEAEDAVLDSGALCIRRGKDKFGNPRYLFFGKTGDGRILVVLVDRKAQHRWRVGMARGRSTGSAIDESTPIEASE